MQTIYLEPDEEITSVIEKLKKQKGDVRFVVPRGALLLQSVVNLKLLKKKADDLNRDIALVTTDKIGRNLASQVGLTVLQRADDPLPKVSKPDAKPPRDLDDIPELSGIKINRYYVENTDDADDPKPEVEDEETADHLSITETDPRTSQPLDEAEPDDDVEPATMAEPDDEEDETEPDDEQAEIDEPADDNAEPDEDDDEAGRPPDETAHARTPNPNQPKLYPRHLHRGHRTARGIVLAIIILLLLTTATAAFILIPSADATVFVKSDPYTTNFDVTVKAGGQTSINDGILAGQTLSATGQSQKTEDATGKKDVGEKAKGTITVTNGWSDQAQPLQAGTRFTTDSSKVFRTTTDSTVPGATVSLSNGQVQITPSTATLSVEADQPGDSYNVAPSHFTIPGLPAEKQAKIFGDSKSAMTGGVTKQLTILTEDDLARAKKAAETEATDRAKADIKQQAGQSILLDEAIKADVKDSTTDKKAGDEATNVTATANVNLQAITYVGTEMRQFIESYAIAHAEKNQTVKIDAADNPSTSVKELKIADSELKLTLSVQGKSYLSPDLGLIQKRLAGKTTTTASQALEGQTAERIDLKIKPAWIKKVPHRTNQIHVRVEPL